MKLYEKCQRVPLVGLQDRRRKLTEDDREDIRTRYKRGETQRHIARVYANKCSRRLVIFVLFPERLKIMQERNTKNKHWKKYHNREKLTKATRNWRNYKYKLFKNKITCVNTQELTNAPSVSSKETQNSPR